MKPKHNILKKALAITGALITSLALSTVALADAGYNAIVGSKTTGGSAKTIDINQYPYYFSGSDNISWRIDLYISTRADGTINLDTDSVKRASIGDPIAYFGSVIYTNASTSSRDVYLQVDRTDNQRADIAKLYEVITSSYGVRYNYNLPQVKNINDIDSRGGNLIVESTGGTVYVEHSIPDGMPTTLSGISADILKSQDSLRPLIIKTTNTLLRRMGTSTFYKAVNSVISDEVYNKAKALSESIGAAKAVQSLMPDAVYQGAEPLVEWAATITPMFSWVASSARPDSFWVYKDLNNKMCLALPYASNNVVLITDAYHSAIYNNITRGSLGSKTLWAQQEFKYLVKESGGYIDGDLIDDPGTTIDVWGLGVFRKWFAGTKSDGTKFNILNSLGTCAYCTGGSDSAYALGITKWNGVVPTSTTDAADNAIWHKGGIYVAHISKKADEVPTYYHIYNYRPGSINPTISCLEGTPADPSKGTFTADKSYGDVVSLGYSIKETKYTQPTGACSYYPGAYPGVLIKQNPMSYDAKNKTPLDNPTIDLDPKNPPKEIHVKVVVSSGPPVYYHKYTYNPDSEDPPTYVGTFPDFTLKPDVTSFTPKTTYGKPVAMLIPKFSVSTAKKYPMLYIFADSGTKIIQKSCKKL